VAVEREHTRQSPGLSAAKRIALVYGPGKRPEKVRIRRHMAKISPWQPVTSGQKRERCPAVNQTGRGAEKRRMNPVVGGGTRHKNA